MSVGHAAVVLIVAIVFILILVFLAIAFLAFFGTLSTSAGLRGSLSALLLLLALLSFDVRTQDSNLVVLMLLEIKSKFLAESQLKKVVIKGFLGYAHLEGGVLEGIAKEIALRVGHSVVELAPKAHLLDDILDGALLSPLLMG